LWIRDFQKWHSLNIIIANASDIFRPWFHLLSI
jgi:hypothetical protein